MMQIWRLDEWDTLYKTIFGLSETGWYRSLGASLAQESQEFLVGVTSGYGLSARPNWDNDTDPMYSYVYEEVLPLPGMSQLYLRELNWLTSTLRTLEHRWEWVWAATQVTAGPSVICSLWKVPHGSSFEMAERTILEAAKTKPLYAVRYRRLSEMIASVIRRVPLYPIYTERLDERIRSGENFDKIVKGL
jgi:hypothetical protein